MKRFIASVFFIAAFVSCNSKTKKNEPAATAEKEEASFFPVTNYIKGQIAEIKNIGITPVSFMSTGKKTDSVWLKTADFDTAFKEFVLPVIDSTNLEQFFSESKFADQTVDAYTFTYSPKANLPDSILLQRWDVYISPSSNTVKRIYIVKKTTEGKELQLTWQSGKWCKTICIAKDKTGKQFVEYEQTIKWSFD